MRPGRDNIAAPDLPAGLAWIGAEPDSMPALTAGGPAIVHFLDFAQLNSVRTLPYLSEWARRYAAAGLSVIGVQAPRFPFGAEREVVAAGLGRLGVEFPVAIDAERELWGTYGCEGWPSLFLWSLGGALSWVHFGEGEYHGTEIAIQEELREADALRPLPDPMAPLRPEDAPGARVMAPSAEVFPGGGWERPWIAGEEADELVVEYEGGGVWATVEGRGALAVEVDGEAHGTLEIPGPGIYELATHERHGAHRVALIPEAGMSVWTVSFDPGLP
ncbi:MAG: hypothetical protein BGO11_08245 [Solirubrobacterales bacterium 70-9]|nr:MAG: hypothetical protein BGO11_08245 [Solirubrobacterales bacterium 70-9]